MSRVVNVSEKLSRNLGTYTLVSGSFNGQGATYFQGLVGKGVTASTTTSNYYSSSNGTIAIFTYDMSFTGIPEDAVITKVYCQVNGHAESTSNNNEYMCVRLVSDSTNLTDELNFKSVGTSNSTQTIECTTMPTVSQLANMKLRCRLGYYGGAINGATAYVEYSISTTAYTVTATSTHTGATVEPSNQEIYHGDSGSVSVYTSDISSIEVTDNGVDVTDSLQYVVPQVGTLSFTGAPISYDSTSSTYLSIYTGSTSDGLAPNTSSSRICVYANKGANAVSKLVYNFDCSSIPQNATITSVSCVAAAACYSNGQYFNTKTLQLYHGDNSKGNPTTITGDGATSTNHNIDGGTWTRSELNDIKIVVYIARGTSNTNTDSSFSFWGATLTVQYTLPQTPYYVYNLTNVTADHTIVVSEAIIEPPEEEPDKTYYSVTISSINATTEPVRGTSRVESGTSEVITIYPSDPQITLVTDNGVDITSQLVQHGAVVSDPTVSTAPGASYGFSKNSSTGYYVSQNQNVDKSAAVCVVSLDLPVRCLVTIQYINYAEASYDFGVFGNIDVPLSNNYYAAGSNGATITDSNYKLACNTASYNTSSVQTLTYEIPSGQHSIYIKYSKDDATASNNDTLQFKILSIEPLETYNYYTYSLSNVNSDHSLIFIFGDVTYYFVNSSINGDGRIYPDGQMVQLPGDTYKLTIVPTESGNTVSITDNNVDVTSNLVQKTETLEKSGQTITVVNYIYTLNNIQETHNINVVCVAQESNIIYTRYGGSWSKNTNIYVKENGNWLQQEISIDLFDENRIYLNNL